MVSSFLWMSFILCLITKKNVHVCWGTFTTIINNTIYNDDGVID